MSLTFRPLKRNRYEVLGTRLPNNPRIKKAQIRNFSNAHYGRMNRRIHTSNPKVIPTVTQIRSWMDVRCPGCEQPLHLGRAGLKKCSNCGTAFNFVRAPY